MALPLLYAIYLETKIINNYFEILDLDMIGEVFNTSFDCVIITSSDCSCIYTMQ